jgi:hypothetical protein
LVMMSVIPETRRGIYACSTSTTKLMLAAARMVYRIAVLS